MSSLPSFTPPHPLLGCVATLEAAVKDVADVDPGFMRTAEKQDALARLTAVSGRLEELRLRVLDSAADVAADAGARDAAAWLAHHARLDGPATRRDARLATALAERWHRVAAGLRDGTLNRDQAQAIVAALDDLPDDLDPAIRARAEVRLVELAAELTPRQLRICGRRVLAVVAPEAAEEHERRALDREAAAVEKKTFLTTRRNGDGTTDLKIRIADAAADRLLTYLDAFTSPRQASPGQRVADKRPYDQRLGHAFTAFLEAADPHRMPLHGGDATTVIITIDLDQLRQRLGTGLIGDTPITAAEARRLACQAHLIPAALGGDSEILDLARGSRLFRPPQRKAMALRDKTCRTEGCDIPAAWCEAHHLKPWSQGGKTDLADGLLLCSWHHHRAHDHRYDTRRLPNGDLRFHRRR